jgi:CRP/FNR family transcriptional regulator
LWIVKEGEVKLLKLAPNGRQQLIGVERAGGSLAETPIFDGGRYPATAQTDGHAILLRIDADAFRAVCMRRPELALKVIKVLGRRLRLMGALIEELSFSTVRARLIGRLLQLAAECGSETPRGVEFPLVENNEELAARLGTVRELVSRNLGRLHNQGLIDIRRRSVTIHDLVRLKEEAARV